MATKAERQKAEAKARALKNAEKKSGGGGSSSSSKKNSSSSSQKKEEKSIKSYYDQKETDITTKADTETRRLQEDLANIMRDAGIAQTRATEDYLRNIGNIQASKSADVSDLTDYVTTNKGRTQEDLDTSLAKESRRYSIEYDKTNQSLADAGMTFSERKQEKIDASGNISNVGDIAMVASRSFQDIARYEAVKNRDIELKYGQATATTETAKARSLEDILNEQADAKTKELRGIQDIATGKAIDIRNTDYAEVGALTGTADKYAENAQYKQDILTQQAVQGV